MRLLGAVKACFGPAAVAAALTVVMCPAVTAGSAASAAVTGPQGGSAPAPGEVRAISCTWRGTCSAVGDMRKPSQKILFTVGERNGVWGTARAVPGLAALPGYGDTTGQFTGLSCSSAGNCGAGGSYATAKGSRAFVVNEVHGIWRKAEEVPGLAKLGARHSTIPTMSCPSAGNCGASGTYTGTRGHVEPFVVSEKRGIWGRAENVSGMAKLNTFGQAILDKISCPSANNCVGVGYYSARNGGDIDTGPVVVIEKNGKWGKARAFPRIIAESPYSNAYFADVWCDPITNCLVWGALQVSPNEEAGFFINEKHGVWGPFPSHAAEQRSGLSTVEHGNAAEGDNIAASSDDTLSCLSPGNCTAGGDYNDGANPADSQPLISTETHGKWGSGQTLPGVAALSASSGQAFLTGLRCRSAGNCSAVGWAVGGSSEGDVVFLSTEKNGVWGQATVLAGLPAPPQGTRFTAFGPVLSCGAPGDCSVGGWYSNGNYPYARRYAFVATQKKGVWGDAQLVH
ncbi:MAG TPA: hypothetical protein VFQ44_12185 [Streptosporangiaceae bacterium]|nr:hypothetical protein [Streptosporangiaceae bacterium]